MSKSRYYKALGLSPDANEAEIRRAYRKMVMKYHPDKNPDPAAQKKFLQIKEAYEVLTGKIEEKISIRPKHTPSKEEEKEVRVKKAQKLYEEQQYRNFVDNELYFRKLTSGFRWKFMKASATAGIILNLFFLADILLPRHFTEDRVEMYNINPAKGTNGKDISLIVTEKGDRYWINNMSYALYMIDPDIYVEQSWLFHNPINLISIIDLEYRYYPIDFNYYRHSWLFILLFSFPAFTIWYKRRTISFTFVYQFSLYVSNTVMLIFILTGERWAHLLTLGFL